MLLVKKGFPEENERVLCTVTAIHYHSVFASLDEYENKSGMIHISEISPGRIRNIRDYVREGKKIVCVVIKIHSDKGHIDLSLRRVGEGQRRKKMDELKQQVLSERILKIAAKEHSHDLKKLFQDINDKCMENYPSLYDAFEDVALGGASLESMGVEKKIADQITKIIKRRIKTVIVEIGGKLTLSSYEPNGIEIIKEAVVKSRKDLDIEVKYLGKGQYSIKASSEDAKAAEKRLKQFTESIAEFMKSHNSTSEFERDEK
jgi:translation initiation factor 2 subunit 1